MGTMSCKCREEKTGLSILRCLRWRSPAVQWNEMIRPLVANLWLALSGWISRTQGSEEAHSEIHSVRAAQKLDRNQPMYGDSKLTG